MTSPLFSIIIPMFNRGAFIDRALDSCLHQDFDDREIVVVDDASTDDSVEVVLRRNSPRIRLVRHLQNRGVCPARNTGVAAATGLWMLFLDSDDELLPGALGTIFDRTRGVGPEIARLVFMYRTDGGGLSPRVPLADEVWDFAGYLRWVERSEGARDFCNVTRKETFRTVRYPDNRALEGIYHLDFARCFLTRVFPDVVGIVHADAPDRTVRSSGERWLRDAPGMAETMEALMGRHGEAVRITSPAVYEDLLRGAATIHFLAGHRSKGLQYAARFLRRHPFSARVWAAAVFGILGPRPLATLKARISP